MKITKELALEALKSVYHQGDDYYSGEQDGFVYAGFSNDYPMQHGSGWCLKICLKTGKVTVDRNGKHYLEGIKIFIDAINQHHEDVRSEYMQEQRMIDREYENERNSQPKY